MQSLRPSEPISGTLKDVPIQKPTDGIFGIDNPDPLPDGQSKLIPNIDQNTSTADAVDALITYMEEGSTNNILGVHAVTNNTLGISTPIYYNGPTDTGIDATLTSTDSLTNLSGVTLEIGHRILITQSAGLNNQHNGVYNIISTTPFSAKRTRDNGFASYFNGTSFIVLGGTEVGKLYSVRFNNLIKDESYIIGYDPILFDIISLSGSSATTGINGVDIFTTNLPAYTYSNGVITANSNGMFPFAMLQVNKRLLYSGATGTENGVYTVTSMGSFGTRWVLTRAADFVAYNGTVINILYYNQIAFVDFDAGVGLNAFVLGTDPLYFSLIGFNFITNEVNNYENSVGITSVDPLSIALNKVIYSIDNLSSQVFKLPLFDEYLTSTELELINYIPVILNSNSIDNIIWQATLPNVFVGATNLQFILEKNKVADYNTNNRFGPFRSQIVGETATHNFSVYHNDIQSNFNLVNLTPNIDTDPFREMGYLNDNPDSLTRAVSILYNNNFSVDSFTRPDGINNDSVRFQSLLNPIPYTYIARFYTYNAPVLPPTIASFNASLIAPDSNQYVSGIPRLRNGESIMFDFSLLNVVDRFIIPAPDNPTINARLSQLNKLGFKVPASAMYSDMDPNATKSLADVLDNLELTETELNNNLEEVRVKFGHVLEIYCEYGAIHLNSTTMNGWSLPLPPTPWTSQIGKSINNINAFHLPTDFPVTVRATRFDGTSTGIITYNPRVLIDECSFKTSLGVFDYGAAFITEKVIANANIRVNHVGEAYDSMQSIQIGTPYQDQLLLIGGKYKYPIGNFSANNPTNTFNFVPGTIKHMRYVTFALKHNFTNVSSMTIELINSDIALTGVDTRQNTGLTGTNGLITTPDFEMSIKFLGTGVKGVSPPFTANWVDANKYYDGSLLNCLDSGEGNVKRLTFGLVRYSGDLLVKIGFSQFTGAVISGVKVSF